MAATSDWKSGKVSVRELIRLAKELKTEDDSNPEYDRALVELIVDVAGLPMSEKYLVAQALGIDPQRVN